MSYIKTVLPEDIALYRDGSASTATWTFPQAKHHEYAELADETFFSNA